MKCGFLNYIFIGIIQSTLEKILKKQFQKNRIIFEEGSIDFLNSGSYSLK